MKQDEVHAYELHYRVAEPKQYYDKEWKVIILAVSYEDCLILLEETVKMKIIAKHKEPVRVVLDISQRQDLGLVSAWTASAKEILTNGK